MSRIIVHNGNKSVMPLMANFYQLDICPISINDLLNNRPLPEISNYLTDQKLCIEITVADPWQIDKILQLNLQKIAISKVVSPYEIDKKNLGLVWLSQKDNWINDYNQIKDPNWPNIHTWSDWSSLAESIKKECQDIFGLNPISTFENSDQEQNSFTESNWLSALFYGSSVCDDLFFFTRSRNRIK